MVEISSSNSPIWHAAEFFFLYAGMFGDTVFIRICLIMAQLLIFVWTYCGCPAWPYFVSPNGLALHIDQLIWCGLCIIVAAVPLFHQLTYNDSKVSLDCDRMTHMAEAIWRDWFRRSGIPRSEFKRVLDCGEWIELAPGSDVPMNSPDKPMASSTCYGDTYYYVVDGSLECRCKYKDGERNFIARPGSFVDAMNLISFLGQPTAALAMQLGPLDVKVASSSHFSLVVPVVEENLAESPSNALAESAHTPRNAPFLRRSSLGGMRRITSTEFSKRGALLLRLHRADLLEKVMCGPSLAAAALRLIVTQSTLDNLFCESITTSQPAVARRYDVIHDMRRRINNSPLPLNAAGNKHRRRKQWWLAHSSLRDFFRPGPEQRAMNAIRIATQETNQLEELRVHEAELELLKNVSTPLSSPYGSNTNLAGYGGLASRSRERIADNSSESSSCGHSTPHEPSLPVGNTLVTIGPSPVVEEESFSRQTTGSIVLRQDEVAP